jgi:hypothetical protein
VVEADLAAGGQGAAGLARLVSEESAPLGSLQQSLLDLALVEGAAGDEVVEVAGRLPQLAVALPLGGGDDPGQLLSQCCPRVAMPRTVAGGRKLNRACWRLRRSAVQPLQHHRGNLAGWGIQVPAHGPLVGVAAGVAAGRGHHITAPAPPVHLRQADRADVAQAGRGQIEMPATPTSADQRPRTRQAMLGGQFPDRGLADGAVDVQDVE